LLILFTPPLTGRRQGRMLGSPFSCVRISRRDSVRRDITLPGRSRGFRESASSKHCRGARSVFLFSRYHLRTMVPAGRTVHWPTSHCVGWIVYAEPDCTKVNEDRPISAPLFRRLTSRSSLAPSNANPVGSVIFDHFALNPRAGSRKVDLACGWSHFGATVWRRIPTSIPGSTTPAPVIKPCRTSHEWSILKCGDHLLRTTQTGSDQRWSGWCSGSVAVG
jgi:hypothetical protein